MKKLTVLQIILISFIGNTLGQDVDCNYKKPHQADQWIFGNKANVDFTQTLPNANPTTNNFNTPYGVSSISDENGNLLFFTNGIDVWNKGMFKMENGSGLNGNNFASQSSIIIPHFGNSMQYFIFTIDMFINPIYVDGVNYSIVDFSYNDYGAVTSKNNLLFTENSQKVCAVKHANGRDYWVIFHGFGPNKGNNFYSYLIDISGVVTNPVVSSVGSTHSGDINNQRGYMKASSNGNKIGLVLPVEGIVELLDFDKATGLISNPVSSNQGSFYYPSGIEFSPDNSKLYVTTSPLLSDSSYLYQFDITSSQPFTNPVVINSFYFSTIFTSLADSLMQAIQLSVDGKIYVSKSTRGNTMGKPNLGVIYNPDRPGVACNYNELNGVSNNGFYLNGGTGLSGLPDFVADFLNIPHFCYFNQCYNDTTDFEIRNTANIFPSWDFKDTGGTSFLADPMKPKHIFSEPGNYAVELTETYEGIDYLFTENVIINPLPGVDIGLGYDTIYILPNSSIRLDAGDGLDIYSWIPAGSYTRYFDVTEEGLYTVTVTDTNCCSNTDNVYVKFANLAYPTAFKPSSSIAENQNFTVRGNVGAIAEYQLHIFNRWGQLIFESDDPTLGWDGNHKGSPAPMGTYVYSSVFTSFESGIQSSIDIKNTGTVTLIR
ncbi:MAG: gliding motility-associated C-terminal domain-containing protein [Bacteroidetes bacterium]|nr:gliding motility-associated C-terminal domain-containing protein [Bacteroidota bacterium]MBL6943120.1 gliding motility-associated C-terminal domain-containing protein [Bacteroidales bacterium]